MARFNRTLDRVKAVAFSAATAIGQVGLFVALALAAGIGSSIYLSSQPTALTAQRFGPWVVWTAAGKSDMDPYTRARYARLGSLPLDAAVLRVFEARIDNAGERLHSSCDYAIEGRLPATVWWSLAVFTDTGRLIPNPAERYSFNTNSIARSPDGSFFVSLSREVRPGNWIPTGGAGRIVAILTAHKPPALAEFSGSDAPIEAQLPVIRKIQCR